MRVKRLVNRYICHAEKTRAAATVRTYKGRLQRFKIEFGKLRTKDLKPRWVLKYLDARRWLDDGTEAAPDTHRLEIVAVEQLQKFAIERGILKQPWFERYKKPPGRRRERIPTVPEAAAILRFARTCNRPFAVILRAFWHCGARPGELASAEIVHYDRSGCVIVLPKHKTCGKVRKPRRIGVGRRWRRLLERSIVGREEGPLFLTSQGGAWTSTRLSRTFTAIRNRLGLSKELVLYSVRHSKGTRVCREKGIYATAKVLGHERVETSERYVHLGDDVLIEYQDAG